jgi:hypothetical protein
MWRCCIVEVRGQVADGTERKQRDDERADGVSFAILALRDESEHGCAREWDGEDERQDEVVEVHKFSGGSVKQIPFGNDRKKCKCKS